MPKVLVLEAEYENVGNPLRRIFDEFPLNVGGKRVLVKPNMLGPYAPESHVSTHPELIRALVEHLQSKGARVTVGDNPGTGGYGAVEKSGRVSGIKEASLGTFANLATEIESVPLEGRGTSVNVSKKILDSDVLISVPKFKTHIFTRITGGIKNSYGFLVGGDKARLHLEHPGYDKFSRVLVDVYKIRVPDLVIIDAVVGLHGNGPTNKSFYHAGKLLASDNGVAIDSVMAQMMGMRPEKIKMLEYASSLGLGEIDVGRIRVEGDARRLKRFRRPLPGLPQRFGSTWISAFFPDIGHPRFDVDPESCSFCGNCRDACPVGAVEVEKSTPRYDYSNCISCYCCMELCPSQAIELHETIRTRIYRRLGYL